MNELIDSLRAQMKDAALRAYACGLQGGNGGNLSVRIAGKEQMLIKASGASFRDCDDDDFVLIDFSGEVLDGSKAPSREYLTHRAVYLHRADIGAIMHCHAPFSIAVAVNDEQVPLVTHHMEMKLGLLPIMTDNAHADVRMAEQTDTFLSGHEDIKAFIQRKHGIFAFGATIRDALYEAELVEESAKISYLTSMRAFMQNCGMERNQ